MTESYPGTLSLTKRVLRLLIKLNFLAGFLILALLVASLLAESWVIRALGAEHPGDQTTFIMGIRVIMIIGICAVPFVLLVLNRLLEIVETVSVGDPFVVENADRLQTIAWAMLGLQAMHLVVGAVVAFVSSEAHPLDIGWEFSVTPWLVVLLCFVLARVFEQGARMREDLQGTV
ncbi:MAG: DUF2975 domain-containing protein [Gemmatimonadales bacterium]